VDLTLAHIPAATTQICHFIFPVSVPLRTDSLLSKSAQSLFCSGPNLVENGATLPFLGTNLVEKRYSIATRVDSRNWFSKHSMMNGAVMASAAPCQFSGARIGGAGRYGLSSVVRLGQLKPLKKVRRFQVQAAVEIDGKVVANGPLRGSKEPPKVTLMVDPLEAKRLAAEEWTLLQERAAFQKKKRIEAINGGWAVLGLTIGIIVEGYTGKGILSQVAGYIDSLAGFVATITPPTLPTLGF